MWPEDEEDEDFTRNMWLEGDSLAPYLGTPPSLLDDIFRFAELAETDVVVDVGCGDGRLPIWAVAKRGAMAACGIEIDEDLVRRAQENARKRGVEDRVEIVSGDATKPNERASKTLDKATLLVFFLLPEGLDIVAPLMRRHLERDERVLCLGWAPTGDFGALVEKRETLTSGNEHIEAFLLRRRR